jgi:hypothetical protein
MKNYFISAGILLIFTLLSWVSKMLRLSPDDDRKGIGPAEWVFANCLAYSKFT